jgi:hypothetical protein
MACPDIHVRWWHSSHGGAQLELLATPSAKVASQTGWTKLSREESDRCERAWQALTDEEKQASLQDTEDYPAAPVVIDEDDDDLIPGIPIGKERLFEVDVRTMKVCLLHSGRLDGLTIGSSYIQSFGGFLVLPSKFGVHYGFTMGYECPTYA